MKRKVVVTGMGCVTPLGNDFPTTWQGIREGRSGIDRIARFDPEPFRSQMAGEVRGFDPGHVIEPTDQKKMDIFIHFALVSAAEALQDAGLIIDDELALEAGVSVGVGLSGLNTIERFHNVYLEKGPRRISPFFIPMVISNLAAGQISMYFNCKNYNTSTASACASSNHSIGDAARIIERGDAKVMLAGGSEASVTPLGVGGFAAMHALSTRNDDPTRASRPYDRDRDGFVIGEGAGIVVLEDYEFAKARGARIHCELAGYGFSADAGHITNPSTEGPMRAMKMTLHDAEVNAEQVDYINTHGTSTPIGDLNELNAIKMAFGEAAGKLSISSSKSMTGHLMGAAGALETMVVIQAIKDNFIPPTINIENIDPECDLDVTPNQGKERQVDAAITNSFGFGGTNATLLVRSI